MRTLEERKSILEKDISRHLPHGWRISSKTDTSCKLIKNNTVDSCLTLILLWITILPGIIYLFKSKGTKSLYIEVNQEGEVNYITKGLSSFEKKELKLD
jgi:hypothetical protein